MRLLTVLWWAAAWLFLALVVALVLGPLLRRNREAQDRMSEEWLERYHRGKSDG